MRPDGAWDHDQEGDEQEEKSVEHAQTYRAGQGKDKPAADARPGDGAIGQVNRTDGVEFARRTGKMTAFKNHYRVLNVEPTADDATIKTAFRRLARRYHPDLAKTARAARKFQEIREAYDVLSDSEKRRRYDELYRTQTALRPVAAGRNPATIRAQARAGSAGLGISLDVLGLRVGLAVDAQRSRRPAAPTQTARRKGPPRRQARDR